MMFCEFQRIENKKKAADTLLSVPHLIPVTLARGWSECSSLVISYWSIIDQRVCGFRYGSEHYLENAIAATGHRLEDVKAIILGHLHVDHAGGLEMFKVRTL